MNTTTLKLAVLVSPLLALAATPARADFDAAVVPAEAQWVIHLDVNELRKSTAGSELMALVPDLDLDSDELPIKVNVPKLLESIGSATAYGTRFSAQRKDIDGTLVVRGTEDLRKIVQGLLLASVGDDSGATGLKIEELTGLGYEAYQADDVLIALPPGDAILVSKSRESLTAARALLESDKGSLARAKNAVLTPLLPKGGKPYLLVASVVPRDSELLASEGPQARILQMASASSVALGEDGTMTTARIQIDATSAEMADRLVKILQGFVAMLSFAETDDAALGAFLRSVAVEKTSSGALLNLAYPTDRLVQMLKTLSEDGRKPRGHSAKPRPPAPVQGRVVAQWTADKDLSGPLPTADNLLTHTVENVALVPGQTIWLNSNRQNHENGRIDYLEIAPQDNPKAAVRHEAENMRLDQAKVEQVEFASGGELISLTQGSGSARLVFHGAAGTYTLTAAYVDETDGQGTFSISISEPKSEPGPEAPKP